MLQRLMSALTSGASRSRDLEYRVWLALHTPTRRELAEQRALARRSWWRPLVDVVVRFRVENRTYLEPTRRSIVAQTWERIEIHEAGSEEEVASAIARGRGDLVTIIDAGDLLAPNALFALIEAAGPGIDLVYADEDRLASNGREAPFFKSGWSPEELASHPYVAGPAVFRRELLAEVGPSYGGASDHERLLHLAPELRRVRHVPDVLLHRRAEADPVLRSTKGIPSLEPARPPRVAVVIPTKDKAALLAACLASLEAHHNRAELELVVVDDRSREEDARALLRALADRPRCQVLRWDRSFNWSAVNDAAARLTSSEYLLFLNNDVEATHSGWLDAMLALACRPEIGLVGAQLLYPDGALQHYGVVLGMTGFAGHLLQGCSPAAPARCGPADVVRNCSSVTGACMLVRRDVFERLGGFDERFILCGSDVALGLRAMEDGLRNVVTPHARLVHHESRTRGSTVPESDFSVSWEVYQPWLRAGDPYYSPQLSLRDTRARIRLGPEDMLAVARRHVR